MKEYAFGIDLGGTTAKIGLFTTSGALLEKWEVATDTSHAGEHILENLAAAVLGKMKEQSIQPEQVEGVGIGVPGPVLDSSIVPIVCANLGGWGERNVSAQLSGLLDGLKVLVGNDANVAALLAGFVAGYVVEFLKKITEKLPASLNGIRPMLIYPLGGILIVGAVMCGINPVMGMINTAVTNWLNAMGGTSKVLLGAIVAGMMSIDMGGPFNKAAYVFGTAALASGNYEVMAAVMVGGMVPPIAIALSTTFCPKKWTADERRNGIVNYVMGLCFVTEGAIPYAAADPLRVLPSCVIGAALSGALSMTFGCALRAPHGGIFVFPVVDHAVMYCVALAIGSVVGAVILSLLKKNRTEE